MVNKLNNAQLDNIQQILTLRYSKNLKNDNPSLEHTSFKNNEIDNPEQFIETSILQTITKELEKNHEKVGISLSSGIDSTLILALLRKTDPSIEIESISVKFSDSIDETENSKRISEKFETNHHVLEINNFLEELPKAISIVKEPFGTFNGTILLKK